MIDKLDIVAKLHHARLEAQEAQARVAVLEGELEQINVKAQELMQAYETAIEENEELRGIIEVCAKANPA